MSIRLRDFIRNIRSCKTAAEERAVIAKECALIRTAFKEGDATYRHRNLAKLLFVHMMGYPCHFGQMECLKLIASPRFAEKRIGYLGLHQIVDEGTELLMLVTNSIKNDLHHPSQYVNGLALTALGNIGSSEMCRSLAREVEDLCSYGNPYVRKKAILCAIRLIRKVEDIAERFIPMIPSLFEEKNHGVLLSACSLVSALVEIQPRHVIAEMAQITPKLRIMVLSGYSSSAEYDVSGVTDPFLQAKLLQTIRLLEENSPELSEDVADMLSQVAASTENAKGAGNAVLLECANTILAVKPDPSLTSLGVGILGRFLQNKDSNIRYVGLSAIQQVAKIDKTALQKHSTMIIECLKDTDTSIRRRALEVAYTLINEQTINSILKEFLRLLTDLSTTTSREETEFRIGVVSKVCVAIERYSPTRRWQIDAMIRVFSLAGDTPPLEVWSNFIYLLAITPELQGYAALKLYQNAKNHKDQLFLLSTCIWAIGEFGNLLAEKVPSHEILDFIESCANDVTALGNNYSLSPTAATGGGNNHRKGTTAFNTSATSIDKNVGLLIGRSTLLESTANLTNYSLCLPELLVTCLVKLSTRLPERNSVEKITSLLKLFEASLSVELQQRACEYERLLLPNWDAHRVGILDTIPMIGEKVCEGTALAYLTERPIGDNEDDSNSSPETNLLSSGAVSAVSRPQRGGSDLLDINELFGTSSLPTRSEAPVAGTMTSAPQSETLSGLPHVDVEDLLADIFGTQPPVNSSPSPFTLNEEVVPPAPLPTTQSSNLSKSTDVLQLDSLL